MPDQNKIETLRRAAYRVLPTCGSCAHGRFAPSLPWGSCRSMTYRHAKHGERALSVIRSDQCPGHEWRESWRDTIAGSGYLEFVEGVEEERKIVERKDEK